MVSLREVNRGNSSRCFSDTIRTVVNSFHVLGIDEDDEHEEEGEERVGLLEVGVPQRLGDIRKAVAGEQTAQLRRTERVGMSRTNTAGGRHDASPADKPSGWRRSRA